MRRLGCQRWISKKADQVSYNHGKDKHLFRFKKLIIKEIDSMHYFFGGRNDHTLKIFQI